MIDKNKVFVNCPFDNDYFPLLRALFFALKYMGFVVQISETSDSGENRLKKITKMMRESMYSIHDLSRMEPLVDGDLPRFNMPFECGIDFGLRNAGVVEFEKKKFLILEKEKYRYQAVISDISGNDIKSHKNLSEALIKAVRDWFRSSKNNTPGYREIWMAFIEFEYDYEQILTEDGFNPNEIDAIPFSELLEYIGTWISNWRP